MKKLLLLVVLLQFGQTFMAAEGGGHGKRPASPSVEPDPKKQDTGQSTRAKASSSGDQIIKDAPLGRDLFRQGPFFQPNIFLGNQGSGADSSPIFAQQEQKRREEEKAPAIINIEQESIIIDDSSDEESGPQGPQVFHSPLPPKASTQSSGQAQLKPTSKQLRNQLEVLQAQHKAQMKILLDAFIKDPSPINHENVGKLTQQQQIRENSLTLEIANAIAQEQGLPVFSHPISRLPIPIPLPPSVLAEAAAAQQLAPVAAAAVLEAAAGLEKQQQQLQQWQQQQQLFPRQQLLGNVPVFVVAAAPSITEKAAAGQEDARSAAASYVKRLQNGKYKCTFPGCRNKEYEYIKKQGCVDHIIGSHLDPEGARFVCPECGIIILKNNRNRHLQRCKGPQNQGESASTEITSKPKTPIQDTLNEHYARHYQKTIKEEGPNFICQKDGCGKRFDKRDSATKHARQHWILDNELYFCNDGSCEEDVKFFGRRENLVEHLMKKAHGKSKEAANKYADTLEEEWLAKQQESQLPEAAAAAPTTAQQESQLPEAAAATQTTAQDENQILYERYYGYDEKERKHLCKGCQGVKFASASSAKKHIRDIHGKKVLKCPYCRMEWSVTRKPDYIDHVTRYPDMKAHRAAPYLPTHSYNCIIPGCPDYQTDKIFSLQEIIEHCRVLHGIEEEDLEVDDFKITD